MKSCKTTAVLFYAAAVIFAGLYAAISIVVSVRDDLTVAPAMRMIILCASCAVGYAGSIFAVKSAPAHKERIMRVTFFIFFLLYASLILTFTLFDPFFNRTGWSDWNAESFSQYFKNRCNLIPFATVGAYIRSFQGGLINSSIVIINLLGNLTVFAPFAFFIPLLWKRMRSAWRFLLMMICMVTVVELLQILMLTGSFDVDDIILNVGGAMMMYGILNIPVVRRLVGKVTMIS